MKKVALGVAVALLASQADAFSPTAPLSAARTGPAVCRLQPSSRSQPSLRSSRAAALTPLMALPPVGPPAPTFDLPSDSGKNVSLKSLMGKWTIAYFYPKAFTYGCTCQAENYQKDVAEYRKTGAEVIGISTDPVDKLKEFKEKYGLSFPLLSDTGGKIAEAYGSALKIPFIGTVANRKTFIIDPKGNLAHAYDSVDPKMDSIVVFAKLKELQNPK